MPTLSMFFGIIVRMYNEQSDKHNKPHVHAKYQNYQLVIDLEGEVLEGDFPKKQLAFVTAWVLMHSEELKANWQLINETGEYFKIEPLK